MKRIVILGSTGSIGVQGLDVIRQCPEEFHLVGLHAGGNAGLLAQQALEFLPAHVGLTDPARAGELSALAQRGMARYTGPEAACALAALPEADIVLHGISGIAGLAPLLAALAAGKTVALANKEALVCAPGLVRQAMEAGAGTILPVDSEQSALFQCLKMGRKPDVARLILTASGGPFREFSTEQMARVTPEQALRHPVWNMGSGITLDSATMFNKGLEIMEASCLFGVPGARICVLVHPQSVVHGMVEFADGTLAAQLAPPDMRTCIRYAFSYPGRLPGGERLDAKTLSCLQFFEPDFQRFPALPLAYEALEAGGAQPLAYQAANAEAGKLFLSGKIGFLDIANCVRYAMARAGDREPQTLEDALRLHRRARQLAHEAMGR